MLRPLLPPTSTTHFSCGLPVASTELHVTEGAWEGNLDGASSNFACFFLPIYIQLIPKKFKLKICDVATRKVSLTNRDAVISRIHEVKKKKKFKGMYVSNDFSERPSEWKLWVT